MDRASDDAAGPDWGQLLLVCLAVCLLALAAVVGPALGGVGPLSVGESIGDGQDSLSERADRGSGDTAFDEPGDDSDTVDDLGDEAASDALDNGGGDSEAGGESADDPPPGDDPGFGSEPDDPSETELEAGERPDGELPDSDGLEDEFIDEPTAVGDEGADAGGDDLDGVTGDETAPDELPADGLDEPDLDDGESAGDDVDSESVEPNVEESDEADSESVEPDLEESADSPESDDSTAGADSAFDVTFTEPLTPGETAEATVTEDGEPLAGAAVAFDGEPVGTTDVDGTVSGTVPYTTELTVQIDPDQPPVQGSGLTGLSQPQTASNVTIPLEADTELAVADPVLGGSEAALTATVNDRPIPDGTVRVDNDTVGSTDADGTAEVPVPDDGGNVTIAVERGEIRAAETVAVRTLSLEVTSLVPLPGRSVDVAVTDSHADTDGAPILRDGEPVATAENGTASVSLPTSGAVTLETEVAGATAETTVDGLYRNAAILAGATLALAALAVRSIRRRAATADRSLRSLPAWLAGLLARRVQWLGRTVVARIVRLGDTLAALGSWLVRRARDGRTWVVEAVRWLPRALADRGLVALAVVSPRRVLRAIADWLRSVLARSSVPLESDQSVATDSQPSDERAEIRSLWRTFLETIRPPRVATRTPGEIGRYAIDRGFPTGPVETVVRAFRDAEYGQREPTKSRLERVKGALADLRERTTDDAERGDSS